MPDVQSNIHFLTRDPLYKTEKPYTLRYPSEDTLPQTNFNLENHENITIHDIRGQESSFSYEKNGFTFMNLDSQMTYEDFRITEKIKNVFLMEIETLLKQTLGADVVQALEYVVSLPCSVHRTEIRKRDPEFPVSTGRTYHYNQPTSMAHIDATPSCTIATIKNLNEEKAPEYLNYRYQCVNIWKPLRGPLRDWPLALCDPTTINPDQDLTPADLVYSEFVVENYQIHFSQKQKWYYLDKQLPSEVTVFRQTDTDEGVGPGVPHVSFENPLKEPDEPPRESIEARFLVYYK